MSVNIDIEALAGEQIAISSADKRNEFNYQKCLAASRRIEDRKMDIVGTDQKVRQDCVESLVTLGERGKSIWHTVARQAGDYDEEVADALWIIAIEKSKKKSPAVFFNLCKEAGIDTSTAKEDGRSAVDFLPPDADENASKDLEEYGFFTMNGCFYKMAGTPTTGYKPEAFSNFTLEVLYHIYNGPIPRRVVRLRNVKGKEMVIDVPTKALTGMNSFKEFTEGSGNFVFWGSQIDLLKIKSKLYDMERSCLQIETLGWHSAGFFSWSNGIYNGKFEPVDENGVVSYNGINYYIPSGNETYADDVFKYANEKKFKFTENVMQFKVWEPEYVKTYGDQGKVMLLYGLACLFSDLIFKNNNNFPVIFFFGEGGSGKSAMVSSVQHLFGHPQDALKISEKANTDKAKIRKLAQFVNSLARLEEYTNKIPQEAKITLRGLYDRFGYERGNLEGRFSTESVPINSGVAITGNEYPDDDPLLQRCILMEYNKTAFTQEEKNQYDKLKEMQDQGITTVTHEVLAARELFVKNFKDTFKACFKELQEKTSTIHGLTNRMVENYAVVAATYKVLSLKFNFSFEYDGLINYMVNVARYQAEKRDSGGETQKFWDTLLFLLGEKKIKHGREFTISGDSITIRFKEIHQYYLMAHKQLHGSPGLNGSTMLEKLKNSDAYTGHKDSQRFEDKKTSAFMFSMSKIGVDLLSRINYEDSADAAPTGPEPGF